MDHWDSLIKFLDGKQRLLISTHVHPDGDAIGSQVALAHCLHQRGKQVVLINMDPTPAYFRFLDPGGEIEPFSENRHRPLLESLDGCLVVDVSDWSRLAELGKLVQELKLPVACIDHHIPTAQLGDVRVIDQTASSTGELLYDFVISSGCTLTQEIADALYTCIMTDTGSFRYTNTTARTHTVAAELLNHGAHSNKIYEQIYEQYSKQRFYLIGHLLANMQFACNDRLVYIALPQTLLTATRAELWETEGFSELARNIATVEISIMFTEKANGETKVSIRSKGRVPINDLATRFGGGGHAYASGATIPLGLDETVSQVVAEAKKLFPTCS